MTDSISARCCIVGGGPAGMMLGFLLARAGIDVVVLEKHRDFLRDFRGDTIHPSTLEVMHELGLLDDFLKLAHQEARVLVGRVGDIEVPIADFAHLPTRCKFIALMPQWDFLDFLAARGKKYPGFRLLLQTEARELIIENGKTVGVRAHGPDGDVEIHAPLVVAADGRGSILRDQAKLEVVDLGAPIDVLWFKIPFKQSDSELSAGNFQAGHILVTINRGDYWQCAYVIPKGASDAMRREDVSHFRDLVAKVVPMFRDRVDAIKTWDDAKLLTVQVNRLKRWHRPGLLFIGDAAHAMSPIGGVGVNLAVQDAVAAANILAQPLFAGPVDESVLAQVQTRRTFPTVMTQRAQILVQNRIIIRVLADNKPLKPPLAVRLLQAIPWLRRIPARLVGVGVRPEHIATPERAGSSAV